MRLSILLMLALQPSPQDKAPEPTKEQQAEKLKLVKDIFKDDYARKTPADQQSLAGKLLKQGAETADDVFAKYVMLREARDLAQACGDYDTAFKAVDEMAKGFLIDATAMRMAMLNKAATSAKDPEVLRSVTRQYLGMVQSAIRADDFDGALAAATKAEAAAKAAQDVALMLKTQEARKEAASMKEDFQKVKGMIAQPATADPDLLGRYLCFVKGDWEAGLPMLASGGKPPLKAVAEKDAANPAEADKQADVADAWWEASKQEKSPWKRQKMAQRALKWLEQAMSSAAGLTLVRVSKRLSEVEEATTGAVDLLHLIDAKKDGIVGEWNFEGGTLVSPQLEWARVSIPYAPPDEYDLTVVFTRVGGTDCLAVGLAKGSTTFAAVIDAHPAEGPFSCFDLLDNVILLKNPAVVKGPFITSGKSMTAVYSVRKSGTTVSVDGKQILSFQGAYSRLTASPPWRPKDAKTPLFVGTYFNVVRFAKISLLPVSGQGKKLR